MKVLKQNELIEFNSNFFLVQGEEAVSVEIEFHTEQGFPCLHIQDLPNTASTLIFEIKYDGRSFLFGLSKTSFSDLFKSKAIELSSSRNVLNIGDLIEASGVSSGKGFIKITHVAGGADADAFVEKIHLGEENCCRTFRSFEMESSPDLDQESRRILLEVSDVKVLVENRKGVSLRSLLPQFSRGLKKTHLLDGVNFTVRAGEIVGLIGHNGSGKSTLLRALVGAIGISSGVISATERPLLLRPGFGFREEFNAKLNTVIVAPFLNRTYNYMWARCMDVLEFADVVRDADLPFRYFSDGMKSRLIFATALEARSSILLMDEIMSAGDINFRNKVLTGVNSLIASNGAGVMASHDLSFITDSCERCIVIENGKQVFFGPSFEAVHLYRALSAIRFIENESTKIFHK